MLTQYLPKGVVKMEYIIRLNNVGEFLQPPCRVETMYAPEMFRETLNVKAVGGGWADSVRGNNQLLPSSTQS